jgi:cobalt/nickel transport system permease protein
MTLPSPGEERGTAVDPRVALLVALVATGVVVTTPQGRWWDHALFGLSALAVATLWHLSPLAIARRLLLAAPVALLIALTVPLSVPGEVVWEPGLGLAVTREGLVLAASIACRVIVAVSILSTVSLAFSAPRLLRGLRGLGCPAPLVLILGMLQRQLGVVQAEWRRMRRAALSRSPARWRPLRALRVFSQMAAVLFVRSLDRGERIHRAMTARGFDGVASVAPPHPLTLRDFLALAIGLVAIACLRVAAVLLG